MAGLRSWLLSPQCQLTLQLSCSLLLASLFVLWQPIHISHGCLVPVFVLVIVGSLATDQHIGTRLQVSAWVLGPTWVAAILAGGLMSLAKLAASGGSGAHVAPAYVALAAVLALLGLALLIFVQAVSPPGPSRVMGVLAVLMYGIVVLLSTLYPNMSSMWVNSVLLVVAGMVVAAAISILIGFLVAPSLASDEVWRLTSEALQGAGAVLSYHTSLLMVDEPAAGAARQLDSSGSKGAQAPAAAAPNTANGAVPDHGHSRGKQLQPKHQQQQQSPSQQQPKHQQQHQEWLFHRPQHHPMHTPSRRSSIDVAAAGAAVVAASEDAFKPASVAAAAALSWVDAADAAVSSDADDAATTASAGGISSARSQHSSRDKPATASLVGSDAVADAAAEEAMLGKRSQPQQQQQAGQENAGAAAHERRLTEQLLQQHSDARQRLGPPVAAQPEDAVDAWVSTAAASVAGPRASEDGSTLTDLSMGSSSVLQANSQQQQHLRANLEGAASLDFAEELDDSAFLQQMRALSQRGSLTRPPQPQPLPPSSGEASANRLSAASMSRPAAAQGAAAPAGEHKGLPLPHVKSTGSALSALSVAGSSTAPADWAQAVRRPSLFALPPSGGSGQLNKLQERPPAAASIAESVISSHASVLQQPPHHTPLPRHQQHTRFGGVQQQQQQQPRDQKPPANPPRRQGLGSRAWSFLTQGRSWTSVGSNPSSLTHASTAPGGDLQQQQQPEKSVGSWATWGVADADADDEAAAAAQLLQPPTTSAQLQPLVGRAKAALASARLEPRWLRPKGSRQFNTEACMKLLDDVELLLVRLSTLEGVSQERSITQLQLHQLAHYRGIADALSLIFAQLTAFIANVAAEVGRRETCNCSAAAGWWPAWLSPGTSAAKAAGRSRHRQHQGAATAPAPSRPAAPGTSHSAPTTAAPGVRSAAQQYRPSPFASAAPGDVGGGPAGGPDVDAASMGFSTLLSAMERQGSGMSSYLWERKTGWSSARELLKREMDASLGSYWWAVRKASKQLPVKVPRSREVMLLIFLWPICNGVLEACERIEASAQQVLKPSPDSSSNTHKLQQQQQQHGPSTGAARWTTALAAAGQWLAQALPKWGVAQSAQEACQQQQKQPSSDVAAQQCTTSWVRAHVAAVRRWQQRHAQWAGPLLQMVLVQPSLLAVHKALTQDVPAALSSKQGVLDMLGSRNFQAGVKLLLATGSVLLATMLLIFYVPVAAHSMPIFGYAAVVLCFQQRVEATVEQAARRVLGTVLGASLGLATNSLPGIFHSPPLLAACLAVASVVLGVLARPQRRSAIVLALLTLCAVSLCGFEAACCSPRGGMTPLNTFLARMASVVGACIYVAVLNRLLLPWYTTDYALEQLADALEQSAVLFERVYHSQLERMRLAEQVAGQMKQLGPDEAPLQVHVHAGSAHHPKQQQSASTAAAAHDATPAGPAAVSPSASSASSLPPAVQLAAAEAAEAQLLVVLRQQVLSRLVAVQLSLAKESVSWRSGVLATPPLVLNVVGAMTALKEALASQRLALAPFTRSGAAAAGIEAGQQAAAEGAGGAVAGGGSGMLHTMVHCYSLWALPLHPLWLEIMRAVQELTACTAKHLRRQPHTPAAREAARAELATKLAQLEARRLDLRHGWLEIRVRLHRAVHGGTPWVNQGDDCGVDGSGGSASTGGTFWPTDSVHLFTFTYGVSRCLNAFAAAAQAVAGALVE